MFCKKKCYINGVYLLRKVDVLDIIKKLKVTSGKAKKINVSEISMGERVLENRIIVLEGYLNFLDRAALPVMKEICERLVLLGDKVYIGGDSR